MATSPGEHQSHEEQGADGLSAAVEARLLDDVDLPDEAKYLVLAALRSDTYEEFAEAAGQEPAAPEAATTAPARVGPARVFLESVEVEGFRGIGTAARLALPAGPGLTLVTGRNGCGKTSFAEAAEVAVSGTSHRWSVKGTRSWRNLHHGGACRVRVTLSEEDHGRTVIQSEWPSDVKDFAAHTTWVQRHGRPREAGRGALGWADELDLFKPFLAHAELGESVQRGGTVLYHAINSALGLDRIDEALAWLDRLVKDWGAEHAASDKERRQLRTDLADLDDDRVRTVHGLLRRTSPDLDALAVHATGQDDGVRAGRLRRLDAVVVPDVDTFQQAVQRFREARKQAQQAVGAEREEQARRRDMLRSALDLHRDHGPGSCPVCGGGPLDDAWAERVASELAAGDEAARTAEAAQAEYRSAGQHLIALRAAVPAVLEALAGDPLREVTRALDAWRDFAGPVTAEDVESRGEVLLIDLVAAMEALQDAAGAELARLQDAWVPVAERLAAWLMIARSAEATAAPRQQARQAQQWGREHVNDLRNERLAPISERVLEVWDMLRRSSNVGLRPLELKGAGNQRRLTLLADVDGVGEVDGAEVMSQGELNALSLSIFLPRVELTASPFGFVVIDDPVQAMDPAKVDGLATVLERLARLRQVVVFSHDDRLPEAVQRLGIEATVLTVVRDEESAVTVNASSDPVARYLADARVILNDGDIPLAVRRRVVPGLCRDALERRCKELFFRRELAAGADRDVVETRWRRTFLTRDRVALAIGRNGPALDRWLGPSYRKKALSACTRGVHSGTDRDLSDVVGDVNRVVTELVAEHG